MKMAVIESWAIKIMCLRLLSVKKSVSKGIEALMGFE